MQTSELAQSTTRQIARSALRISQTPLSLIAGGDRIELIGQKTVGYATRDGANVEIAFEAAKVRRPLLSVVTAWRREKGHAAVLAGTGGFIIR